MTLTGDPDIVYLTDFMDAYYGVGQWTYREAPHSGSDCTPAMHNALQWVRQHYGYGRVKVVGNGIFRFLSPINSELLKGNFIEGSHANNGRVIFDMNDGIMFHYTGAGGFTGGGLKRLKIFLEQGHVQSNVYSIMQQGDAQFQPDDMQFEDLYISALGGSTLWAGWHADGSARMSPQGIRVALGKNIQVFNCRGYAYYFSNLVQCSFDNLGSYNPATPNGADLYIEGGTVESVFHQLSISTDINMAGAGGSHQIDLSGQCSRLIAAPTAQSVHGYIDASFPLFGQFGSDSDIELY